MENECTVKLEKNNFSKIDSFEAIFNWRKTVGMKRGVLFDNGADDDTLILKWVIIYDSYEKSEHRRQDLYDSHQFWK